MTDTGTTNATGSAAPGNVSDPSSSATATTNAGNVIPPSPAIDPASVPTQGVPPAASASASATNVAADLAGEGAKTTAPPGTAKRGNPYVIKGKSKKPKYGKKKSAKKDKTKNKRDNKIKVVRVSAPEDSEAPNGFFFFIDNDSWVESKFTSPWFQRKIEANQEHMEKVECVDYVMEKVFLTGYPNGPLMNSKEFPTRALVKTTGDEIWTHEQISQWFKDIFIPSWKNTPHDLWDNRIPPLGDIIDGESPYWGFYFHASDMKRFLYDHLECIGREDTKVIDYLKESKAILYSFWEPGMLPMALISAYSLLAKHMDPMDWKKANLATHDSDIEEAAKEECDREEQSKNVAAKEKASEEATSTTVDKEPEEAKEEEPEEAKEEAKKDKPRKDGNKRTGNKKGSKKTTRASAKTGEPIVETV